MTPRALLNSRRWLLLMAAVCVLAVGGALVAQHAFDMRPCPWCILQRLIYVEMALLCVAGALVPSRPARIALIALVLLFAVFGAMSAVYQHEVAANSVSCNLSFAEKVISGSGIDSAMPFLFQVTASCAESVFKLFGVPFEFWSLMLFSALVLGALALLLRSVRLPVAG